MQDRGRQYITDPTRTGRRRRLALRQISSATALRRMETGKLRCILDMSATEPVPTRRKDGAVEIAGSLIEASAGYRISPGFPTILTDFCHPMSPQIVNRSVNVARCPSMPQPLNMD